ncbi:MAG: hypothetical protein O7C75_03295 [Verrucomicrobia bacterium]|nr:hypothetical protein [Verrucomicrobiota bacterium]
MTTQKQLSKEKILEALKKNKITTLEQFIEALMPDETGGFSSGIFGVIGMAQEDQWVGSLKKASFEYDPNEPESWKFEG